MENDEVSPLRNAVMRNYSSIPNLKSSPLRRFRIRLSCYLIFAILSFLLMIAFVLASFLAQPLINNFVEKIVKNKVVLKKDSLFYPIWADPPVKIFKDFYILNWNNPNQFIDGTKPDFKLIGPYRYREYRTKFIHNISHCVISYIQHKTYEFDTEASGSLNDADIVRVLNLPVAAAVSKVAGSIFEEYALDALIIATGAKIYKDIAVHDLIWGYKDTFIDALQLAGQFPKNTLFRLQWNDYPPDYEQISQVYSGECHISKLGQYRQWDGNRTLTIWQDKYANMINGTEGLFFSPFLEKNANLTVFVDDIQRSVDIMYTPETREHKGVHTWRYVAAPEFFLNQTTFPPNERWYSKGANGLIYIGNSTTPRGNPVWGSNPLFLGGDPDLINNVTGITPDPEHYTYADIEPITGAMVYVHRQVQINLEVRKSNIRYFRNIPDLTYFPILFADENVELSPELYELLGSNLLLANLGYSAHWALLGIGLLFLLTMALFVLFATRMCYKIRTYKTFQEINDDQHRLL